MTNPLVPNYKPDVGRLVTDRFDFQNHVDGTDFRHEADQIDLVPNITIDSVAQTNVQDAIAALTAIVTPPTINDASTTVKGIVKLAGDIAGTATSVRVTGLQGKAVSATAPTNGQVLTFNSSLNLWNPATSTTLFNPSGDLAGNNIVQQVIGLSGSAVAAGTLVSASTDIISFTSTSKATITQDTSALDGLTLTIRGQSSSGASKNGGYVVIGGGGSGAGGLAGGVSLQLTSSVIAGYPQTGLTPVTAINLIQLREPAVGRAVLSLCHPTDLTSTDMPANTGNRVIYIRNADSNPSTGNPSNGAILYASSGKLYVKEEDGNQFVLGSIPNPSIWGDTGQQTYTSRNYTTSAIGAASTIFSRTLSDLTSTRVDVILVGRVSGTTDTAQFNLSIGYIRNGGAPAAVGTTTNADARTNGAGSGWTVPTITVVGNVLTVSTGFSASTEINWIAITQLVMVT